MESDLIHSAEDPTGDQVMELDDARIHIRQHYPVSRAFGHDSRPRLKILCPLHGEKTPSLQIDDESGLWYCFGCKEGGDVFSAMMATHQLSFREAVSRLAEDLGIQVRLTQGERIVHDRKTGEGTQAGKPVHFILSRELKPLGTEEYCLEAIQLPRGGPWLGLIAGPQRWEQQHWDNATRLLPWADLEPEVTERSVRAGIMIPWPGGDWSSRRARLSPTDQERERGRATFQKIEAGCGHGHPILTVIGGDGEHQQEQLDQWGIGALLLIAPSIRHTQMAEQLTPALRSGTPVFIGSWNQLQKLTLDDDVTDEQFWSVSRAFGYHGRTCGQLRELLKRQTHPPVQNPDTIAQGLRRLKRRAMDRDLFHPGPSRQQALIGLLTGLPADAVRRLIWQREVLPTAVAGLLGHRTVSAEDTMLANAIWSLRSEKHQWNVGAIPISQWPASFAAVRGTRPAAFPLPEEARAVIGRLRPDLLK